jgi:MOSC domain-containing protein YiiM
MTQNLYAVSEAIPVGHVLSVNVGTVRMVTWEGQRAPTGIWKSPVAGRVAVRGAGIGSDEQADRQAHGGPDKAVYAYAREDAEWWERQIARPLEAGCFGENLTLTGVDITNAVIGERWAIGSAVLEVAQPRIPCWKLAARMNDTAFPKRFLSADRPGAYLRIAREGDVGAADMVRVIHRPSHGVTISVVNSVYRGGTAQTRLLLDVPELPEKWRLWARKVVVD